MRRSLLAIAIAGLLGAGLASGALAASPAPSAVLSPAASAAVSASPSPTVSATPWLITETPAPAETMPIGTGGDVPILPYLIQLIVVTAVVGALGYMSLKLVKDKVPGLNLASGKQIHVVDRVALDPKRMMFVVNVGGRYWLLAATEMQVTTIAELSKDDLGGQFAQLLEQEKHRGETL